MHFLTFLAKVSTFARINNELLVKTCISSVTRQTELEDKVKSIILFSINDNNMCDVTHDGGAFCL